MTDCIIISRCKISTCSIFAQVYAARKAQNWAGFALPCSFSRPEAAAPLRKTKEKWDFVISFPQNLRGFAASTRVLPHGPLHFRRCFVSWLTSHLNFRTLYMPLHPFAQLCFLQDAINPFQKYKNSSFSLCNQLKYCIFVNNVHLSAMSPTKE